MLPLSVRHLRLQRRLKRELLLRHWVFGLPLFHYLYNPFWILDHFGSSSQVQFFWPQHLQLSGSQWTWQQHCSLPRSELPIFKRLLNFLHPLIFSPWNFQLPLRHSPLQILRRSFDERICKGRCPRLWRWEWKLWFECLLLKSFWHFLLFRYHLLLVLHIRPSLCIADLTLPLTPFFCRFKILPQVILFSWLPMVYQTLQLKLVLSIRNLLQAYWLWNFFLFDLLKVDFKHRRFELFFHPLSTLKHFLEGRGSCWVLRIVYPLYLIGHSQSYLWSRLPYLPLLL